jgi:hypothetical protein
MPDVLATAGWLKDGLKWTFLSLRKLYAIM